MSKKNKIIKEPQKDKEYLENKLWRKEVLNRIKFGIPQNLFLPAYGDEVRICELKYFRDFDCLYFSFVTNRYYDDKIKRNVLSDSIKKYKEYTFKQIEDAGGALKLSLTCPFVKIIRDKDIEYKGRKIEIFYREKNATISKKYPNKVIEIFKQDSRCRAVAYCYYIPITRRVIIEKCYNC